MPASPPFALRIAYDGTEFAGWQIQPEKTTVQGLVREALGQVHAVPPEGINLVGAGRTDSGAHALGQVASYDPPTARAPALIERALRSLLPGTIRVLSVCPMREGFHALRSATGKRYRYRIVNRALMTPFELRWAWQIERPLDLDAMSEAASMLEGTHDFAAFQAAGSSTRTTTRSVQRLEVRAAPGAVVEVDAVANGFLYKMVRNITGFLVEVGSGKRPGRHAATLLSEPSQRYRGRIAPACGLCLISVAYGQEIDPL